MTEKQQKQLREEEKEYKSKHKLVQEKLIKFATRIPAFMYLTDFRENTLQDVITKLEPDLFFSCYGSDGEGLSPAGEAQGVQYRADESSGVRVSTKRNNLQKFQTRPLGEVVGALGKISHDLSPQ